MQKRCTRLGIAILACCLCAIAGGCGGSESHTVSTTTTTTATGSLEGVDFIPADHSLAVSQDVNPRVFWHPGFLPPAQFNVSLREVNIDSTSTAVRTNLYQITTGANAYELRPVTQLDAQAIYFITVDTGVETKTAMFLTGGTRAAKATAKNPASHEGSFEHHVVVESTQAAK